eukprot:GFYU01000558.1.p1 GENE.GFYU01000558.1~~GFYU01000558.1.p1  ORF type:complete len:183 (-),score=42.32 GFYU01000558.1:192-740(-)
MGLNTIPTDQYADQDAGPTKQAYMPAYNTNAPFATGDVPILVRKGATPTKVTAPWGNDCGVGAMKNKAEFAAQRGSIGAGAYNIEAPHQSRNRKSETQPWALDDDPAPLRRGSSQSRMPSNNIFDQAPQSPRSRGRKAFHASGGSSCPFATDVDAPAGGAARGARGRSGDLGSSAMATNNLY